MNHRIALAAVVLIALVAPHRSAEAFPEPSRYPVSWELKFEHAAPRRIVVEVPGSTIPKAYWYMTYTVTNKTDKDVNFLPVFEMVTKSGRVLRSDRGIPKLVFDRIKTISRIKLLEPTVQIAGVLHVGEDQARDGVAIWEETEPEMGAFTIFVGGLSGENTPLNDNDGKPLMDKDNKPIILFKTLQLDYTVSGDEVYAGNDPIKAARETWVMR
jgi:hypothetical protein